MWSYDGIEVQVGITTYCNAKCPQCDRTKNDGLGKIDNLPLVNWSLDDFKKAFTEEDLMAIKSIDFCSSWGDSVMNPHLYDIVKHCFEVNPEIIIVMPTNGSIQTEDWWWKFGLLSDGGKKKLHVKVDIDGPNQEIHSYYRRGTNLEKILNNIETYTSTRADAIVTTILFKHNEDYLDEIKELVKTTGARRHIIKFSEWFHGDKNISIHYDENGNEIIFERTTADEKDFDNVNAVGDKITEEVNCGWQKANRLSINFDGTIHSCCYYGGAHFQKAKYIKEGNTVVDDFYKEDELNIFNNSLKEMVEHQYFKELSKSFDTQPSNACIKHCTIVKNADVRIQNNIIARG